MTELYIDGQLVNLPETFQVDFYVNNPFFTKKGDYTYDIDISLRDANNAKIYNHIDRLHATTHHTQRSAVLLVDGRVLMNGTEIILSIEKHVAKIQLVSGNSELNYLSAGDRTLRELDLGEIPPLDATVALSSLSKYYPESDFVCCPVIKEKGPFVWGNLDTEKKDVLYNDINWDTRNGYQFKSGTTFVAQPYLLAYVDKVIRAIGYDIEENTLLDNSMYRKLIVVNGYDTSQYNRILPNWTIDEFITEIEKLFNVVFLVNKVTKKIRILNTYYFYTNGSSSKIDIASKYVNEAHDVKYDVKESLYITYDSVSYKLPSGSWYKYQELDEELVNKCTIINVNSFAEINISQYDGYYIFHDISTDMYFVRSYYAALVPVDSLKEKKDESSSNKAELKIIPAEIYDNSYYLDRFDFGGSKYYTGRVGAMVPVVSNVREAEEQKKLYEAIESGIAQDEINDSNIFISIYIGGSKILGFYEIDGIDIPQPQLDTMTYPQCTVSPYVSYQSGIGNSRLFKVADDRETLSILGQNGWYNNVYSKNLTVNTDTEYIVPFVDHRLLDPMGRFVIDNRLFYCKRLLYRITSKGLSKNVEGTFYAM